VKLLSAFVPDWDSYKIYLWGMKDSDPLQTPYVSSTNVAIIGDAAHAFMPTIGMGASLAMEDAEMLASRLASVARRYADREQSRRALKEEVFVPFTRERVPVWNDLMYRARWAARGNFFRQGERGRFSIAPQIPGFIPSRVVGAMEWVADRLHL
jgi:2-polyprenyl-6-methoxyphenol hydroxylase-like FAD-dependent oxidoreductase